MQITNSCPLSDFEANLVSLAYQQVNKTEKKDWIEDKVDILMNQIRHYLHCAYLPELLYISSRIKNKDFGEHLKSKLDEQIAKLQGIAKHPAHEEHYLFKLLAKLALRSQDFNENTVEHYRKISLKIYHLINQSTLLTKQIHHSFDFMSEDWIEKFKIFRTAWLNSPSCVSNEKARELISMLSNEGIDSTKLIFESYLRRNSSHLLNDIICAFYPSNQSFEYKRQLLINQLWQFIALKENKKLQIKLDRDILNISPLSVAVLLGDFLLVERFLEAGFPVNEADELSYTALHFAAIMADWKMLVTLYIYRGDFQFKTESGSTPISLLRDRGYRWYDPQNKVNAINGIPIKLEEVKFLIRRSYYPHNVYTVDALLSLRIKKTPSFKIKGGKDSFKRLVYEAYLRSQFGSLIYQPPLYLRVIDRSEDGQVSPLKNQLDARAVREIKPGDFIIEYTGQVEIQQKQLNPVEVKYRAQMPDIPELIIQAGVGGSFAEIINHGPPNCGILMLTYEGTPHLLIYALRTIAPNEVLYIDYGPDYFREIDFFELSPQAINRYMIETHYLTVFMPFTLIFDDDGWSSKQLLIIDGRPINLDFWLLKDIPEKEVRSNYHNNMLSYLFCFPNYLIELIKSGEIKTNNILTLLNYISSQNLLGFFSLDQERLQDLISQINEASYLHAEQPVKHL